MAKEEFPLEQCTTCIHSAVCKLKDDLNKFLSKNTHLDLSGGLCDYFEEDGYLEPEDSIGFIPLDLSSMFPHLDSPGIEYDVNKEMIGALEEDMAQIMQSGDKPESVVMSHRTMQMFLNVDISNKVIHQLSTGYGSIKVMRDDSIGDGIFIVVALGGG